jgi:hypothetical protein
VYHKPKNERHSPIRLIRAEANGSRCFLCGGQVDDSGVCGSGLGHQMGQLYLMDRKNAPSLFG